MAEIKKTCLVHGVLKASDIKSGVYRGKKYNKCRLCDNERSKRRYDAIHKDAELHQKEKQRHKDYWAKNKTKIAQQRIARDEPAKRRETYQKYAPRYRAKCNAKQKEYREQLHDTYIRKMIQDGNKELKFSDIPQSLVEFKRSLILMRKKMKEFNINQRMEKYTDEQAEKRRAIAKPCTTLARAVRKRKN